MNALNRRQSLAVLLAFMTTACATAEGAAPWLDFAQLQLGPKPNQALACSPEMCPVARPTRAPIALQATPQQVAAALARIEPGAEFRTETNGDIRARYVAVTPIMRFRDDVDLLIRAVSDARTELAVYSRSRIGYSDLGANAARVVMLERRLRAALA